jgi:hypothetical protein
MSDTRSPDLKSLRIEPVEVRRMRINSAGGDMGEVRVSLSRVKFAEATVDAATAKTAAQTSTDHPRLKPGAHPQRGRLRKPSKRTGKTKWG